MANRRRSRRSPSLPPLPGTHLDGATVLPKGRYPMPSNIQPTNFIRISQVNSVRGVYTIDPGLSPPASMGIPATAGAQKNVVMDSQKGNLNVDLFVLPSSDKRTMVSMTLKSEHGTARVRVHDAESQDVSYIRGSLNISVSAVQADIYIPRSFRGPLQMTTKDVDTGRVRYSEAVKSKVAPVFSVNGTYKSFIGGLPLDGDSGDSEPCDRLTAQVHGPIHIYYDDEGPIPTGDISSNGKCTIF